MRALILATTFLALPTAAMATTALPSALIRDGGPVSALCFSALDPLNGTDESGQNPSVSLIDCGQPEDVEVLGTQTADDGTVTTTYKYKQDDTGEDVWSSYKVLGPVNDGLAVLRKDDTGGSGLFSTVVVVGVEGDRLTKKRALTGGDRCNGGIESAHVENGVIITENSITPSDFVPLSNQTDPPAIEPYQDLEASAASCFATLESHDGQPVRIVFDKTAGTDQEGWTENYTYQTCFNRLFRNSVVANQTSFDIPAFRQWMTTFIKECVPAKTKP